MLRRHGFLFLAVLLFSGPARAEDNDTAHPPGPFTAAQASAGRLKFLVNCTNCHGAYMAGGGAPALTGPGFAQDWGEKSTRSLLRFISENMPLNSAGLLPRETYIDITAFILAVNGAKPGPTPLTADSDVRIGTIADGQTVTALLSDDSDIYTAKPPAKKHR